MSYVPSFTCKKCSAVEVAPLGWSRPICPYCVAGLERPEERPTHPDKPNPEVPPDVDGLMPNLRPWDIIEGLKPEVKPIPEGVLPEVQPIPEGILTEVKPIPDGMMPDVNGRLPLTPEVDGSLALTPEVDIWPDGMTPEVDADDPRFLYRAMDYVVSEEAFPAVDDEVVHESNTGRIHFAPDSDVADFVRDLTAGSFILTPYSAWEVESVVDEDSTDLCVNVTPAMHQVMVGPQNVLLALKLEM